MGGRGSGGHNKKTVQQHLVEGTYRKDRHGDLKEAPAKADVSNIPKFPQWLDAIARNEWKRICLELVSKDRLKDTDHAILEGYCAAYSKAVRAERELNSGFTYEYLGHDFKMKRVKKPEVQIAESSWSQVKAFAVELGITPASRPVTKDKPKKDPMKELLDYCQQSTEG
jgi:P27 family predicted phage terminase small subunit